MEWITCPGCGLKHSPRPDGLCPRCRTRIGEVASQPLPPNPAFDRPAPPTARQAPGAERPMATSAWDGGPAPLPTTPVGRTPQAAEVTVGSLVSRTFSTWWANVGKFTLLLVLAYLPVVLTVVIALARVAPGLQKEDAFRASLPIIVLGGLATAVLILATYGGITFGSLRHLAGKRETLGSMFGVGLRRSWTVFVVSFAATVLITLGMLALVVPGIIVAMGLMVCYPIAVAERVDGVGAALKRSFALTKGSRWTLFGAVFVVLLATWLASMIGGVATGATAAAGPAAAIAGLVVNLAVQLAMGSLVIVLCAVAYHDLRLAKEGADTSELAAVFE